jgi:hypothetical protein
MTDGQDHSPARSRAKWHGRASRLSRVLAGIAVITFPSASYPQANRAAPADPGPRNGHGLAYDSRLGQLILFGGATAEDVRGDTWLWHGGEWQHASVTGPEARTFPSMVYDSGRGAVVLFGGNRVLFGDSTRPAVMLGDTWIFRNGAWTRMAAPGPSPRAEAAIAYDPARRRVVLFGGYELRDGERRRLGDTWEWDGTGWTRMSSSGPTPRNGAAMAYDPSRRVVVLFGGSGGPLGDTWSWNGRGWTQLGMPPVPGRFNTALAWDPAARRLVRFGGWDGKERASDTWELGQAGWVRVQSDGPSGRNHAVLVSATDRGSILLYGGHDGERVFADLWERKKGRWVQLESRDPVHRVANGH